MLRAILFYFFHRPVIRRGWVEHDCTRTSQVRNPQFLSFLAANGCLPPRRLAPYDAALRRRRWFRRVALAGLAVLGAWVVIESANALSMF
jgi:hypothetical protein